MRRGTPASAQSCARFGRSSSASICCAATGGIAAADTGWTMPPGSCARRSWYCALAQCSTRWALARSMLPCGWGVPSSTPLSGLLEASAALQRLWRRRRSPAQHRWPKTCLAPSCCLQRASCPFSSMPTASAGSRASVQHLRPASTTSKTASAATSVCCPAWRCMPCPSAHWRWAQQCSNMSSTSLMRWPSGSTVKPWAMWRMRTSSTRPART